MTCCPSSPSTSTAVEQCSKCKQEDEQCEDSPSTSKGHGSTEEASLLSQKVVIRRNEAQHTRRAPRRSLSGLSAEEKAEVLKEDARRRIQNAGNRYQCPHCDYCAPFPNIVRRHIRSKHSGSHECSKCSQRYDNQSQLRSHKAAEHPKIHYCKYCSFSHKVLAEVRKHTFSNHENGVLCTMPGCGLRISRRRLKAHLRTEHADVFPSSHQTNKTEQPSRDVESFRSTCPYCEFVTSNADDASVHILNVHEKGIECPVAGCFAQVLIGELEDHLTVFHGLSEVLLGKSDDDTISFDEQCRSVMRKRSSAVQDLDEGSSVTQPSGSSIPLLSRNEMNSCTTASISGCVTTTDNTSDDLSDLDDVDNFERSSFTRLTDSSVAGSQCGLCGKSYRSSQSLRKHVRRVHEKAYKPYQSERKHPCMWEGCMKAYRTRGLLEDHLNYHRGITPYRCNHCNMSFHARARYAVHLQKYHGESIRDHTSASYLLTSIRAA